MSATIVTMRDWVPLSDTIWNAYAPRAKKLDPIGTMMNHVCGRMNRIVFASYMPIGQSPSSSTDPVWRFRYRQNNPHGTELHYRALGVAQTVDGVTTARRFGLSPSGPYGDNASATTGSALEPELVFTCDFTETITVAGSTVDRTILVEGGFRLIELVVTERPNASYLLDDAGNAWQSSAIAAGAIVRDDPWIRLRRLQDSAWNNQRRVRGGHVVGNTDGAAKTTTTSANFVNIFDTSVTSRSSTSPGVLVREYNGGMGRAASVGVSISILARVTSGTGKLKAESSLGSTAEANVTSTTAGGVWVGLTSGSVLACSTVEGRGAGLADDKVDLFMQAPAGQTIYVWGYAVQTWPEF